MPQPFSKPRQQCQPFVAVSCSWFLWPVSLLLVRACGRHGSLISHREGAGCGRGREVIRGQSGCVESIPPCFPFLSAWPREPYPVWGTVLELQAEAVPPKCRMMSRGGVPRMHCFATDRVRVFPPYPFLAQFLTKKVRVLEQELLSSDARLSGVCSSGGCWIRLYVFCECASIIARQRRNPYVANAHC